jgi:hypothetical protein
MARNLVMTGRIESTQSSMPSVPLDSAVTEALGRLHTVIAILNRHDCPVTPRPHGGDDGSDGFDLLIAVDALEKIREDLAAAQKAEAQEQIR